MTSLDLEPRGSYSCAGSTKDWVLGWLGIVWNTSLCRQILLRCVNPWEMHATQGSYRGKFTCLPQGVWSKHTWGGVVEGSWLCWWGAGSKVWGLCQAHWEHLSCGQLGGEEWRDTLLRPKGAPWFRWLMKLGCNHAGQLEAWLYLQTSEGNRKVC